MRLKVRDVMTADVVTVIPDTDFQTIARLLDGRRINQLPVIDEERRVIGIVSEADLLSKAEWQGRGRLGWFERWLLEDELKRASASLASQMMTRDVVTIGADASVTRAAHDMRYHVVKALPVVDVAHRLVGIVSRADLLKTFVREDSAIRDEVREEVLRHTLTIDPDSLQVTVHGGTVQLEGIVESRGLMEIVAHLVEQVAGVVNVQNELGFTLDDRNTRREVEPADNLDYSGPPLRR